MNRFSVISHNSLQERYLFRLFSYSFSCFILFSFRRVFPLLLFLADLFVILQYVVFAVAFHLDSFIHFQCVWLDPQSSAAIFQACDAKQGKAAKVVSKASPITLKKALKNEAELKGMRDWYDSGYSI
jgi:hypothetical protein